jgi:predicted O-methyltransferase YrrM
MRSFRHWTPTYIRDRVAVMRYQRTNPEAPWLTREMTDLVGAWLKPGYVGLEFGSGRSTLWFAARVGRLTSVEHDAAWHATISARLSAGRLTDIVDYRLCDDGVDDTNATRYAAVAGEFPAESLDFVLVDGMCRDHCALASVPLVKRGGWLIVDNVNWYVPRTDKSRAPNSRALTDGYATGEWQQFHERVAQWKSIWTSDGVTDTAAWIKPA